jgi:eukaryotic-like serine/threonine-protein kinase
VSPDQLFADRYRLERRLGVGGMATVQLAFDTRLERYVAVKLLAEHLAEDGAFVNRFRREALAAARLVHPNIVQVYDFGLEQAGERQFIVMEFVDGASCAELLRDEGRLEPREAVAVLTQACRGLDYAHRNGVVHRDVKPGNLLRSRDHVVKLADFGIAKAAEQSDITKVGSVLGTAAYLSPEQARGEPAGPPADLYALGVVSYQLLTGRLPYEAASLTDLARQQESGPPVAPDELEADVTPELAIAVMRALSPTPEKRYGSGSEMERALLDGARGVVPARPTGATQALGAATASTRALTRDRTAATSAMPRTTSRRATGQLPQEAPPRRAPSRAAPAAAQARGRRKRRSPLKWLVALVVLLALVAGGVAVYQATTEQTRQAVRLKEQVRGDVQDSVDSIKDLIRDNTR